MDNVRTIKEKEHYEISYKVPTKLKEDLDLYIEDCIGMSRRAILWDCQEEKVKGMIQGTVELYFDEFHEFDEDCVKEVSECFQLLSEGKKLFYSLN